MGALPDMPLARQTTALLHSARQMMASLPAHAVLILTETDLDAKTGSVLVRSGKGGKRRTVGMDDWAWEHYSDALVMPT